MNRSRTRLAVRSCAVAASAAAMLALGACGTYVPEGAMVVSVKNSRHEFDRADLRPANNELLRNQVIIMKWYDTNTFLTSSTVQSGSYTFRARNYDGTAISRQIQVVPDQDLYEIDMSADNAAAAAAAEGPAVKGRLQLIGGVKMPPTVTVLFIGNQVAMQTAEVKRDGTFSATAPAKGSWKIEVHQLGDKPRSYVHPVTSVNGPIDLGAIALK